jgi:CheY-like chemotaxis protein
MGKQTRIIIIDDDQDACELLKLQLEDTGRMSISYHTNGNEAFDIISQNLPDIAILDINMPGTNGVEISSALSANPTTSSIPILYLSGMLTPDEAEDMGKGENNPSLISKGSPIEELIAAIDTLTTT